MSQLIRSQCNHHGIRFPLTTTLLQNPQRKISGISGDFICRISGGKKQLENASGNVRSERPYSIFNRSKNIQHFSRTPRGTFLAYLITSHEEFLENTSDKMRLERPHQISNHSKKIQHYFNTHRGIVMVSLYI